MLINLKLGHYKLDNSFPVLAKDAIACGAMFLLFITDVVKEIQTTKYLNMVTKCLVYIQTSNSCTAEQLHSRTAA